MKGTIMDLRRIVKLGACLLLSAVAAVYVAYGGSLIFNAFAVVNTPYTAPVSPDEHEAALRWFAYGGLSVFVGLFQLAVALKFWPYRMFKPRRPKSSRRIGF